MIRLAVRCRPEQAEFVLAELAVLAPNGVEETTLGDGVEFAIYGGPGELPDLGGLDAVIGGETVEVVSTEVADDWADRWREFHRPVLVGERIWVRPPWAERRTEGGVIDLVIDPGQAFGTGAHPTTRLCLEAMLAWLDEPDHQTGAFADLGAGSGVLAIAAAKLGFYPVWAYDHDPAALDAIRENAEANNVDLNVARVDLRVGTPPFAPLTVANLVAPLLAEIADRIEPGSHLPGTLVCSGLLPDQVDETAARFRERGLAETGRATDNGWSSLTVVPV